jgi:hypothetical protein
VEGLVESERFDVEQESSLDSMGSGSELLWAFLGGCFGDYNPSVTTFHFGHYRLLRVKYRFESPKALNPTAELIEL